MMLWLIEVGGKEVRAEDCDGLIYRGVLHSSSGSLSWAGAVTDDVFSRADFHRRRIDKTNLSPQTLLLAHCCSSTIHVFPSPTPSHLSSLNFLYHTCLSKLLKRYLSPPNINITITMKLILILLSIAMLAVSTFAKGHTPDQHLDDGVCKKQDEKYCDDLSLDR